MKIAAHQFAFFNPRAITLWLAWLALLTWVNATAHKNCAWFFEVNDYVKPFHRDLQSIPMPARFEQIADSLSLQGILYIKVVVDTDQILKATLKDHQTLPQLAQGILLSCFREDRVDRGAVLVWQDQKHWGLALGNSVGNLKIDWIEERWERRMANDLRPLGDFFLDLLEMQRLQGLSEAPATHRTRELLNRTPKPKSETSLHGHVAGSNTRAIAPNNLNMGEGDYYRTICWLLTWGFLMLQWGSVIYAAFRFKDTTHFQMFHYLVLSIGLFLNPFFHFAVASHLELDSNPSIFRFLVFIAVHIYLWNKMPEYVNKYSRLFY